jgi:hypothetical protein
MIRTSSTHAKTWYLFSEGLKFLYKKRKAISKRKSTDFEIASVNSSILIHLSATLEGAINSLMYTKLAHNPAYEKAKFGHDMDIVRLFRNQISLLQKASWQTLSEEMSKSILGFSLSSVYKKDWPAIKYLFEFRNILAHGGVIVKNIDKISTDPIFGPDTLETTEESITKKELFILLHKNKLIESTENSSVLNWKFINSEVTDFFHFHTKTFLTKLYIEYEKKHHLHSFLENDKIAIKRL